MLKTKNTIFDIIAILETRILKNTNIVKNIKIPNFSHEFTPTESTAGGTLLYIANHLAYRKRNDLNLYKKNYLEPTFIEITNPTKTVIIVGLSTGIQQWIFLLGDFNVDLLKYEQHKATNEFLDSLSCNMVLAYIIQPTRINSHSKSVIDNIFSNDIFQEIISGNLTSTISYHLTQFLIALHIFSNAPNKKFNIFEREEFILDYFAIG